MSCILNKQVLVLNSNYIPISYYPLSVQSMKKILKAIFKNKLNVVEVYDEKISMGGVEMSLPKTVVLKKYIQTRQTPKFSRYNVYLRDKFTCQYCGKKFGYNDLTFDHVIPRYAGGHTDWNNIVTACHHCNTKKGCKDLNNTRFTLLSRPHVPSNAELLRNLKELQVDIGSQLHNWEQWINNI